VKKILILLLLAGCTPLRTEAEFQESCEASPRIVNSPDWDRAARLRSCMFSGALLANIEIRRRNQEVGAMAAAIVLGAASDAMAEHNFYVYDVPRARRYLEGTRR
jgi:hypothetical protein